MQQQIEEFFGLKREELTDSQWNALVLMVKAAEKRQRVDKLAEDFEASLGTDGTLYVYNKPTHTYMYVDLSGQMPITFGGKHKSLPGNPKECFPELFGLPPQQPSGKFLRPIAIQFTDKDQNPSSKTYKLEGKVLSGWSGKEWKKLTSNAQNPQWNKRDVLAKLKDGLTYYVLSQQYGEGEQIHPDYCRGVSLKWVKTEAK